MQLIANDGQGVKSILTSLANMHMAEYDLEMIYN